MPDQTKRPLIGIGVMIQRPTDGYLLLGQRQGKHGAGEWSFPGGHLDFGETIFQTAEREALEETGLQVRAMEIFSVSDDFRYIDSAGKHYVTIGVRAEYQGGEPQLKEPDRCAGWQWFPPDRLPEPLFEGPKWMVENLQAKIIYRPAPARIKN